MKIVLKRGSSKQEFALIAQSSYKLGQLTFLVFDFVGLVNDNVMPFDLV